MRIVKTKSGYKIKFGWWIFASYLQEYPASLEGYMHRKDAVFATYEAACDKLDEIKELEGY